MHSNKLNTKKSQNLTSNDRRRTSPTTLYCSGVTSRLTWRLEILNKRIRWEPMVRVKIWGETFLVAESRKCGKYIYKLEQCTWRQLDQEPQAGRSWHNRRPLRLPKSCPGKVFEMPWLVNVMSNQSSWLAWALFIWPDILNWFRSCGCFPKRLL